MPSGGTLSEHRELQKNQSIDGRFIIHQLAGSGGMGEVYKAHDLRTLAPVAIKVLRSADPQNQLRFLREAEILTSLHHPGIVRHLGHGTLSDGVPYLAMEWLEGEDLATRLRRGTLPLADAVSLAIGAARALELAHQSGIVHRDWESARPQVIPRA